MTEIYCQYGDYKHATGEVELSVARTTLFTEAATPYATQVTYELNGMLTATSVADMDAKVAALDAAYSQHDRDFTVRTSTGTILYLSLDTSDTNGGIRVMRPPNFPSNRAAAYVTFLPYFIALEAEVPLANASTYLLRFTERIQRSGGGLSRGYIETLNTAPVRQLFRQATVYRAVQQGSAVGLYSYPFVPAPLWPGFLVGSPDVEYVSPNRRGSGYQQYPVSWSYQYESHVPLYGIPHRWGA